MNINTKWLFDPDQVSLTISDGKTDVPNMSARRESNKIPVRMIDET
jgi:hypothetical protein